MAHRTKRWKRLLKLLCFAVLISSVNVFIHLQFAQTSKADIEQFNGHVLGQMTSAESLAMVYRQKRSVSVRFNGSHLSLLFFLSFYFVVYRLFMGAILEVFAYTF